MTPLPAGPGPAPRPAPRGPEGEAGSRRPAGGTLVRLTDKTRNPWVGGVFAVIVLVLLVAIGFVVYDRFYADPTRNAAPGHCLADVPVVSPTDDVEISPARLVHCLEPDAVYLVEGRINDLSEAEANSESVCEAYEDATFAYRVVPPGGTGYVLCLSPIEK
jgi:hypothetical protein